MAFLIPMFLLNSALPVLSERDSRGEPTKGILGKTFLAVTLLSGIAGLFAYFWARPLVELLTTSAFLSTATRPGSDTALRLLAIPMFLNGIALFGFYVLLTRHRWKELTAVLGAGAILSVTLNMLLIPDFGFVGASATSIAVHIFLSLFLLPLSFRAMRFSLSRQQLIRWFFSSSQHSLSLGYSVASCLLLMDPWNVVFGIVFPSGPGMDHGVAARARDGEMTGVPGLGMAVLQEKYILSKERKFAIIIRIHTHEIHPYTPRQHPSLRASPRIWSHSKRGVRNFCGDAGPDLFVRWNAPQEGADVASYRVYLSDESILENGGQYDDFETTDGPTPEQFSKSSAGLSALRQRSRGEQ